MENRNENMATYSPPPNDPDILWHYIMCGRIQGPFVEPGLCIVRFWLLITAVLRVCIVYVLSLLLRCLRFWGRGGRLLISEFRKTSNELQ